MSDRLAFGSEQLVAYVVDLEDLVRWLAIPYGPNDPIWPREDAYGNALEANARLDATWRRVVRDPDNTLNNPNGLAPEVPSEEGAHTP